MNLQNISTLTLQLQSLGFGDLGYLLLKRISFKPASFFLSQKMVKEKDQVSFHLFFENDQKQRVYILRYYDAILQKGNLPDDQINGINIFSLDKRMAEIDWKEAFDLNKKKLFDVADSSTWDNEEKVENVIDDFLQLEKIEEGKIIGVNLKLKYWTGTAYQELFGAVNLIKNKSAVTQRFYFSEEETGISMNEAYRFLQNRWLEKQIQVKEKHSDSFDIGETENASHSSSTGSLLKKKRLSRSKPVRSTKLIH